MVDASRLALAAVVLTAGSLADRFGRRRVFASGLMVLTVASASCAAAGLDRDAPRGAGPFQGLGAAILFATSLALLSTRFPIKRERLGARRYGATIGASFAIGAAVGAFSTALDSRWVFLVNLPIGVAAWSSTLREVRVRDPARRG